MFNNNIDKSTPDNILIEQTVLWNKSAFEIIYERYNKQLYNYIWTILNFNTEEAWLVLSDVFIKVYEYIQNRSVENLKSLLYRIAHNTSVDRIRTNQNQNIKIPDEAKNYIDHEDKIQKENLNIEYKRKLMKKYLSKLDEKYRSVLYLVYYEDKSYDEIAIIQQSNKNSIGTLAFQWKKKLEEIIKNAGIDPDIFLI